MIQHPLLSLSAYATCTDICSIFMPIVFHGLEDRISCFVIYQMSSTLEFFGNATWKQSFMLVLEYVIYITSFKVRLFFWTLLTRNAYAQDCPFLKLTLEKLLFYRIDTPKFASWIHEGFILFTGSFNQWSTYLRLQVS